VASRKHGATGARPYIPLRFAPRLLSRLSVPLSRSTACTPALRREQEYAVNGTSKRLTDLGLIRRLSGAYDGPAE
jgi:hypothetical protein